MPAILVQPPMRVVLVVAAPSLSSEWQVEVCEWLLRAGCLYLMVWGENCRTWDESMDEANFAMFDGNEIPEGQDAMTTWHDKETLAEVFWFAKNSANHHSAKLENTLLLHISENNEEKKRSTSADTAGII